MYQVDVDDGHKPGPSKDERVELVKLRRENRVQAMEIEILKRPARTLIWRTLGSSLVGELAGQGFLSR
jgi:hypothetical protein